MSDYLHVFLTALLPYVAQAVAVCLGLAAIWLLRKLTARLHIQANAELEAQLWDAAHKAVFYAEEWAHATVKSGGPVPAGPAKLEIALKALTQIVEDRGLAKVGEEKLTTLLEAALHVTRPVLAQAQAGVPA